MNLEEDSILEKLVLLCGKYTCEEELCACVEKKRSERSHGNQCGETPCMTSLLPLEFQKANREKF
jgi:hypothetical protein